MVPLSDLRDYFSSRFPILHIALYPKKLTTSSALGGRKNVNCSLRTDFSKIFQSKEFRYKLQIFLLDMNEFLSRPVAGDTAFFAASFTRAEDNDGNLHYLQCRKAQKFATIFAVRDLPVSCDVRKE